MITHIAGMHDVIADAISRFQMQRFRSLAPDANPSVFFQPRPQDQCQSLGVAPSTRRVYQSRLKSFYEIYQHINLPSMCPTL